MEIQALNVIKKFAHKYQFEEALDMINDIPEDIEADDLKAIIESILLSIHTDVKNDIMFNDDETYEMAKEEIREATNLLLIAIGAVKRCEDIENDAVAQVKTFLNTEKEIIKNYTSRKAKRSIGTMSGKTKEKLNGFYEKNEKKIIGGVVVVVVAGSILLVALSHNNKKGDLDDKKSNKPETTQTDYTPAPTTTPVVTETPAPTVTPVATPAPTPMPVNNEKQEIANKITAAATKVYTSWSQITNAYTIQDIENIIKALNGLESNLTLDEADMVIQNVLELATIPKVNNILANLPYTPITVDVVDLLLSQSQMVTTMQQLFDAALLNNDLRSTAFVSLNEQTLAQTTNSSNNLNIGQRIVWARLAEFINGINATLGEEFEYNGNTYSQKDILDSNFLENIVNNAKSQALGMTR